jgi:hypothetical protein
LALVLWISLREARFSPAAPSHPESSSLNFFNEVLKKGQDCALSANADNDSTLNRILQICDGGVLSGICELSRIRRLPTSFPENGSHREWLSAEVRKRYDIIELLARDSAFETSGTSRPGVSDV